MTKVLEIRTRVLAVVAEYEFYLRPLFKFLLALFVFQSINGYIGYYEKLDNVLMMAILALICCLLPVSFTVCVSAVLILVHLFALSKETALVGLLVMMIIYFLYFRFAPKDGVAFMLTPVLFRMNIPYVMPMSCGLLRGPYSFIGIECGTVFYYFLAGIHQNASAILEMSSDTKAGITDKIRLALGNVYNNKEMILVMLVFALATVAVYMIRQVKADHAWTMAIVSGILIQMLGLFIGYLMLGISNKTMWLLLGNIIALAFSFLLEFIFMNLDYARTERVQFEDEDYYYYVKAVPKRNVGAPEKSIQHFGNTMSFGQGFSKTTKESPEDSERKQIAKELDIDEEVLK